MIRNLLFQPILLVSFLNQAIYANGFFRDHTRGWHWYESLPVIEDEPDQKEEVRVKEEQHLLQPKTPSELVKAYRQELESRLHKAWVYPTPQNLKAYQEMQQDLMERSKTFATVWMKNVYQHPELDHTLVFPVNQQARHLHIDLEKDLIKKTIQQLSRSFGLFFFFSGDCPYCHQFAPIVKRFAETYGWKVIAIRVDAGAPGTDTSGGGSLTEFPDPQQDNGLFQLWGLKVLPSLIAVNPKTQEAVPIAYGLTALDEMESRIMTLMESKP